MTSHVMAFVIGRAHGDDQKEEVPDMRLPVLLCVFVVFVVFSTGVAIDHGAVGFLTLAAKEPWALQMLLDLAISLFLFSSWMKRDAKDQGLPFVPYALLTLTLGSIGALAYLLHREIKKRAIPTR